MNINCLICTDIFSPNSDIYTTPCGHIFHYHCLLHWLEISKTCPQCRTKITVKSLVRLYINVASSHGIEGDITVLQHKMDGMEFQLRLKDKDIKNFTEKYKALEEQNKLLRNCALSPLQQFLLCLRFYAAGEFMISSGDHAGVHKSTVSNIVRRVTNAICSLKNDYVNFPTAPEEITTIQQGFFNIARFPRVILLVDGTHVKIQSPGGDQAEYYRNRKGFFSLNVMVACDHNLKIRNIVARWPGSSHDMIVYMNSNLKWRLENTENCLILGDSGYAVNKNFMTPLNNPITVAESRYQESLIRTRNAVERCIGVWKRRFPCLALGLRTKLELTQDIIVATSILHNLARSQNEPNELQIDEEIQVLINEEVPGNNDIVQEQSAAYRSALIEQYFARL